MKALIQRVSEASVSVGGRLVSKIDGGILLLLGVEKEDAADSADKLLDKVLSYRIFDDGEGRMNLSLRDVEGGLLVVSQFTLVAETQKGLRPGFSRGASPDKGLEIYDHFVSRAKLLHSNVGSGMFGADMKVSLVNDGPVTFLLEG